MKEAGKLTVMVSVDFISRDGQTAEEAAEEMAHNLEGYMTDRDGSFQEDYGLEAWGGYDGPRVFNTTVKRAAPVDTTIGV